VRFCKRTQDDARKIRGAETLGLNVFLLPASDGLPLFCSVIAEAIQNKFRCKTLFFEQPTEWIDS
jgi:hypothetical protein